MSVAGIVVLGLMAVAGCSSGTPVAPERGPGGLEPDPSSSGRSTAAEIELRYDETLEYEELKLRWLELQDSRCPIGVQCVWAGEMVATLELARDAEGPVEVELTHRVGREPETARAFDYELRLLGVDPHPRYGVTSERADYVAHIEIRKP